MINFIAGWLMLLGLWWIGNAWQATDLKSWFGYQLPTGLYILGATYLLLSVGLFLRRPLARIAAAGLALCGLLAPVGLLIYTLVNGSQLALALLLFSGAMRQLASGVVGINHFFLMITAACIGSMIILWAIFDYLRWDTVQSQFGLHAEQGRSMRPIVAAAVIWALIFKVAPSEWTLHFENLPSFMKNAAAKQHDADGLAAIEAAKSSISEQFTFSADERTVYFRPGPHASLVSPTELVALDVASGRVEHRLKGYFSTGMMTPDGRKLVYLDWGFVDLATEPPSEIHSQALVQFHRPYSDPEFVSFVGADKLMLAEQSRRDLVLIDLTNDKINYSVPANYMFSDGWTWSSNQKLFASASGGHLRILHTDTGEFSTTPTSCKLDEQPFGKFSQENSLLFAPCVAAADPEKVIDWTVFNLSSQDTTSHTLPRGMFLFASSSQGRALYVQLDQHLLSQYPLPGMGKPDWQIPLPPNARKWDIAVTDDGGTMLITNTEQTNPTHFYARIDHGASGAPQLKPLPSLIKDGTINLSPSGNYALIRSGRRVELLRIDSLGLDKPESLAVDLITGERLKN